MSSPKHTPGPWSVDASDMYLLIRADLSDRKHMAHEEVVARVSHLDDARLIAAAPELLEALASIYCVPGLQGMLADRFTGPTADSLVALMAAAIAKATGGAL